MKRRRDRCTENRQDGRDAIDCVDHIRSGLTEDGQEHGTLAAEETKVASIRNGIDDFRDILEPNGSTRMASDYERHVLVGFEELVGIANIPCLVRVGESALGQVGIGGLQRCTKLFETDAVAIELVGIGFNANGRDLRFPKRIPGRLPQLERAFAPGWSWRRHRSALAEDCPRLTPES